MRAQQTIWQKEHATSSTLPSLNAHKPYNGVVAFIEIILQFGIAPPQKVIDVGCGKGRNALYLAQHGFHVYGVDYIDYALEVAHSNARDCNVISLTDWFKVEIDTPWPFLNNYFDLALDCFTSIDIETEGGRKICRDELYRTLKPGGYALICVVSSDDEFEKEIMHTNPGKEKNSSIWLITGKFQKNYDEQELRDFYRAFNIIELRKVVKPATKLGRNFNATNFWLVLQKPIL